MEPEVEIPKTLTICALYEKGTFQLSKPPEAMNGELYSVNKDTNTIYVSEKAGFPVYLQFESNVEITGVGFAEKLPVQKHHAAGHCGGCFELLTGVVARSSTIPLISNAGDDPKGGYHFDLWREGQPTGIDPRIYNHGEPPPDGGKLSWWRRFLRWWR